MDEKGVSGSVLYISKEKSDILYPMCFDVSYAFFALGLLSRHHNVNQRISEVFGKMLQGNTQLLGLLVWKVHRTNCENSELLRKLDNARKEIDDLKRIRKEDAKANEKVVSIFNTQEQCWLSERRKLRQHIGLLTNEIKLTERKMDQAIAEVFEKLKEMELLVLSKDKVLAEEERKRKELEDKLVEAENVAKELRDISKTEAEEHSSEIWKYKTAVVELVSNQRQLEADLGRALRQVENAKQELKLALEKKEESVLIVQKLSAEVIKTRKGLEQNEKILSSMMRKSKLDEEEQKMMFKERQSSKTMKKQAEFETDQIKAMSESKCERRSFKNVLAGKADTRRDVASGAQGSHSNLSGMPHNARKKSCRNDREDEQENPETIKNIDAFPRISDHGQERDELGITAGVRCMEGWVHSKAEKYTAAIEQRHHLELDAVSEQMWLKDEKLEALHRQFLSMDLEAKQMMSHVEGLHKDISQLRDKNTRLEALLLDREKELNSLKERLGTQPKTVSSQKTNLKSSLPSPRLAHDNIWSKVKIIRKKIREKEKGKIIQIDFPEKKTREKNERKSTTKQSQEVNFAVRASEKDPGGKTDIHPKLNPVQEKHEIAAISDDISASSSQLSNKKTDNQSKIDLHALGISYKIKRLKQQLLIVESLIEKQENGNPTEGDDGGANTTQWFYSLISLLNRQVARYQSLQGKADNLCKRMLESKLETNHGNSGATRTKGNTRLLEQFLEDTFQLQRYIVATGQKLMEVQSKISSEYVGNTEEHKIVASFDIKKFADNIRTLLQDVQRGLEVRISRIIGDLGGTLACNGIIRLRR